MCKMRLAQQARYLLQLSRFTFSRQNLQVRP